MAILTNFPLLLSDQTEVIRIYLERKGAKDSPVRAPEAVTFEPLVQRSEADRKWFPGDMAEFD